MRITVHVRFPVIINMSATKSTGRVRNRLESIINELEREPVHDVIDDCSNMSSNTRGHFLEFSRSMLEGYLSAKIYPMDSFYLKTSIRDKLNDSDTSGWWPSKYPGIMDVYTDSDGGYMYFMVGIEKDGKYGAEDREFAGFETVASVNYGSLNANMGIEFACKANHSILKNVMKAMSLELASRKYALLGLRR